MKKKNKHDPTAANQALMESMRVILNLTQINAELERQKVELEDKRKIWEGFCEDLLRTEYIRRELAAVKAERDALRRQAERRPSAHRWKICAAG